MGRDRDLSLLSLGDEDDERLRVSDDEGRLLLDLALSFCCFCCFSSSCCSASHFMKAASVIWTLPLCCFWNCWSWCGLTLNRMRFCGDNSDDDGGAPGALLPAGAVLPPPADFATMDARSLGERHSPSIGTAVFFISTFFIFFTFLPADDDGVVAVAEAEFPAFVLGAAVDAFFDGDNEDCPGVAGRTLCPGLDRRFVGLVLPSFAARDGVAGSWMSPHRGATVSFLCRAGLLRLGLTLWSLSMSSSSSSSPSALWL